MVEIIAELLFGISLIFYLARFVYQLKVSKENGKSTTPVLYWVLTIIGVLFIMAYGVFVGSIIIPLSTIPTIFAGLYNIYLELQKKNQIILQKKGSGFNTRNKAMLQIGLIETIGRPVSVYLLKEKHINKRWVGMAGIIIRHKFFPSLFLCVNEKYRNKSYGTKLTKQVLENKKGLLFLTVQIDNVPAMKIYKKLGFIKIIRWGKFRGKPKVLMVHV